MKTERIIKKLGNCDKKFSKYSREVRRLLAKDINEEYEQMIKDDLEAYYKERMIALNSIWGKN